MVAARARRHGAREIFELYGDNADEELHCVPRASAGAFLRALAIEARMETEVPVLRWEMPTDFASSARKMCGARKPRPWCEDHLRAGCWTRSTAPRQPASARISGARRSDGNLADADRTRPEASHRDSWSSCATFRFGSRSRFCSISRTGCRGLSAARWTRGATASTWPKPRAQRYGARIAQVMLSVEWYREQMPRFKAAFEDGSHRDSARRRHPARTIARSSSSAESRRSATRGCAAANANVASRRQRGRGGAGIRGLAQGCSGNRLYASARSRAVGFAVGRVIRSCEAQQYLRRAYVAKGSGWIATPLSPGARGKESRAARMHPDPSGGAEERTIATEVRMSIYWKWRCEACGYQFELTMMRLPEPCHRCGGGWFRKVGESDRKHQEAAS